MARTKYREHLQMVYAVQWKGDNLVEMQEFAPGMTFEVREGNVLWISPTPLPDVRGGSGPPLVCQVTEWLMDDPYVGHLSVITDLAFKARFDPTPQSPTAKPAPSE